MPTITFAKDWLVLAILLRVPWRMKRSNARRYRLPHQTAYAFSIDGNEKMGKNEFGTNNTLKSNTIQTLKSIQATRFNRLSIEHTKNFYFHY